MSLYFLLKKHIQNFCGLLDKSIISLGKIIEKVLVLIIIFILLFLGLYWLINVLNLCYLSLCGIVEIYKIHLGSFFMETEAMPLPLNWEKIKAYQKFFYYSHNRLVTPNYLNVLEYRNIHNKNVVQNSLCKNLSSIVNSEFPIFYLKDKISKDYFFNNAFLLAELNSSNKEGYQFKKGLSAIFFDKNIYELNRLCNYIKSGIDEHHQVWVPLYNDVSKNYSLVGLTLTTQKFSCNCRSVGNIIFSDTLLLDKFYMSKKISQLVKPQYQYIVSVSYIWDNINPLCLNENGTFNYEFFTKNNIKLVWLKDTYLSKNHYLLNTFLSDKIENIEIDGIVKPIYTFNHLELKKLDFQLKEILNAQSLVSNTNIDLNTIDDINVLGFKKNN